MALNGLVGGGPGFALRVSGTNWDSEAHVGRVEQGAFPTARAANACAALHRFRRSRYCESRELIPARAIRASKPSHRLSRALEPGSIFLRNRGGGGKR